jgi:hypothetical protein
MYLVALLLCIAMLFELVRYAAVPALRRRAGQVFHKLTQLIEGQAHVLHIHSSRRFVLKLWRRLQGDQAVDELFEP